MRKTNLVSIIVGIIILALPVVAYAINEVTLDGDTSFELTTTDSSTVKTITGLNGGNTTQLVIDTGYMDVTLDNGSDITFSNDGTFYFNAAVQSGTGQTINPSCPTSLVRLTSTANAVVRITLTSAEPSCASSGGSSSSFVCGNNTCESGETATSCPVDCNAGGGGGGGGGGSSSNSSSNRTTSKVASKISTIKGNQSFSRPVQFKSSSLTVDTEKKTKKGKVTSEGTLKIKPNSKSTVYLSIPKNTDVEGNEKWDGKISPPLVRSNNKVSHEGSVVKGAKEKLYYRNIDTVIEVGSNLSPLKFTNKVKLEVPVKAKNGAVLNIYSSEDGKEWVLEGKGTVKDGKVTHETDHTTFFAYERADEVAKEELKKTADETAFNDISGHWAKTYIESIVDKGIASGKTSTTFAPDENITRAELTKIALEALFTSDEIDECLDENTESGWSYVFFKDVPTTAWYAKYVCAAKTYNVVEGVGGNFMPNKSINRAEALKILLEATGLSDIYSNFSDNYKSKTDWTYAAFPDVGIGEWFAQYVAYAKDNDIVGGYADGDFKPGNKITRAEVAKIITKILDLVD